MKVGALQVPDCYHNHEAGRVVRGAYKSSPHRIRLDTGSLEAFVCERSALGAVELLMQRDFKHLQWGLTIRKPQG